MQLNPAQTLAVEHDQGPLLVLAGAGSGKTRVITHRIARLIERGVRPEAILAVSFTNKASAEMAQRLRQLVGSRASALWLSTFHSFGVRFLMEESRALWGEGRFVIFDQADSVSLVRSLVREHLPADRKLDAYAILARISVWKNQFLTADQLPENDVEYDQAARAVYEPYHNALRAMRAFDFDDLVGVPVQLLRDRQHIRQRWQQRFRHLLIDEFQDTNRAQLELARLLTNELGNICVVGDDDQAIYGWRGADVRNILEFESHFESTTVVKLEENYRSFHPVLTVANAAIAAGSQARHRKVLRTVRTGGTKVRLCKPDDEPGEAKMVASEIREMARQGRRYKDCAILYRSNQQARILEEELRVAGIPYRIFGGTQFYDRKEVKDAIAYLRVLVHPHDELSLRRVVNYPPRGVGDTSIQRISQHALARGVSFATALSHADEVLGVPEQAKRGVRSFRALLDDARKTMHARGLTAGCRMLIDRLGLREPMGEHDDPKAVAKRRDNLDFFLRSVERYEHEAADKKPSLHAFLTRLTLRYEQEEEQEGNWVTLSTLHTAKGLEFPWVFLIGCVEGRLPHGRVTDPKVTEAVTTDVEEERRLFYVGVTRARDQLYLSAPKRRMMRGTTVPLTPSRFLDNLPSEAAEDYEPVAAQELGSNELADMTAALLKQLEQR